MKIAVIGIGNLLAADDGVGIRSIRVLQDAIDDSRVVCHECERGGLDLLDQLEGFDRSVLVDAARTGTAAAGSVTEISYTKPYTASQPVSLHTLDLVSTLALGAITGIRLPEEVSVIAVEAADIETFGASCTPCVESAIPVVLSRLKSYLLRHLPDLHIAQSQREGATV